MFLPCLFVVLTTIQFDCQFQFVTVEIEDISANGMLATKFFAGKTTITQQTPKELFGVGLVFTKDSGVF